MFILNKGFVWISFVAISVGFFSLASQVRSEEKALPKEKKEKIGYSIGVDLGREMKGLSIEIDPDMVARGINDAFTGKPQLSDTEMHDVLAELNKEAQKRRKGQTKDLAEKNRVDGEAFLRDNAQKSGVVTLPSGLQYKVIKEGSGKIPKINDTVIVHYRGSLIDGTQFDNSRDRNQPAEFVLGKNVIPAWNEAIQRMKAGSRWFVIAPGNLAYGERGNGGIVGPNAVLMFDIELLAVK